MRCIHTFIFQVTGFYEKSVGMHLVCYYPYFSCLCTFWPCHPYLLLQFIYLLFILVHVYFFSSIATESVWCHCGLVHSLWPKE